MANLIIKSSANDLVIQGSDESPAITVGATGTTTFAENSTMSGNVTMSGTANNLGTVTAGAIPSSLVTGNRLIQHQYGFKGSGVDYAVSSSSTSSMEGAPFTISTPAFDTTSASNTIWQISSGMTANNEVAGAAWCMSMKIWKSYDGGTNWTADNGIDAHANAGKYVSYGNGPTDEYVTLSIHIYLTLTASESNTKIGCAYYSQESDNSRYNLDDGMGCFVNATQYLVP